MKPELTPNQIQKFDIASLTTEVNDQIENGSSLAQILEVILKWIETKSEREILSSVLLYNEATQQLFHGAAPSLPEDYNQAVNGIFAGPSAGSCGTAAFTKRQIIVEDIENDPLWLYYKALALPLGLRACWSTPLLSNGKLLGTFAMYYKHTRKPSGDDLQLIHSVTALCIKAIESKKNDFRTMTLSPTLKAI